MRKCAYLDENMPKKQLCVVLLHGGIHFVMKPLLIFVVMGWNIENL